MAKAKILELLDGKWVDGTRPKDLFAQHVSRSPAAYVADIVAGLGGDDRKVQGGCAELASLLSEAHPELLYPHVDIFCRNLSAKEPVLRWEAACTLGNLARVDARGVTREAVGALARHLRDKSIVLQGHAVRALAKIAVAFPDEAPRIQAMLIEAKDEFPAGRIGYVVEAMGAFAGDADLAQRARAFLLPYAESDIKPVAAKAKRALKALSSAPAARGGRAKKASGASAG